MHIMNESIPKGTLPKRQNLPWLPKNLLQTMRKRNYLYRRAKTTGVPRDMGQYRTARNKTVTMLCNAKKDFFNKLNTADRKQFWKTMKYLRRSKTPFQYCLIMVPLHTMTMTRQTCSIISSHNVSTQSCPHYNSP